MSSPWDLDRLPGLLLPDIAGASFLSWSAVAAAALYVVALVRDRRPGARTPWWRAAAFLLGCGLVWLTTGTGLERAGSTFFSIFMLQQLTLMIVAPSLLVLGSPGRLMLRAVPHRGAGRVLLRFGLGLLRSRTAAVLLHPVVGIGLFLLAYYGLYLTGVADLLVREPVGHGLLEVLFLVSGLLFAIPVLGSDPMPRRVTHGERALDVFVEMGLHAFFGVLIMVWSTPVVPTFARATLAAGGSPLGDQAIAGGLAWSYGEGPAVLTLLYVMHRWFRADSAAAEREDARSDGGVVDELAAYNEYLARLAARDAPRASDMQDRG